MKIQIVPHSVVSAIISPRVFRFLIYVKIGGYELRKYEGTLNREDSNVYKIHIYRTLPTDNVNKKTRKMVEKRVCKAYYEIKKALYELDKRGRMPVGAQYDIKICKESYLVEKTEIGYDFSVG